MREHPIRGEGQRDFLGESEGSLPPPQVSGNFVYRHHVEPRVKLYSPREESFPISLKYIDVSRTTHTNFDVKQEKRIDDYWNIGGSKDWSDSWTGFTQCTITRETSRRIYVVWGETDKSAGNIQAIALDKVGKKCKAEGEAEMVQ